ncbi:hypothetical protein GCM10010909_23040 [Acidocella aquatica]|uniref:Bacteriophage T5 Orf172 DNA-binding domain-containing protein n=1 Tax=Acidocella aquatica TaxID=1922313 RepID=A0ABQ6ABM7_9PROT|nr:GIY-YIG nuclease family protein [Acidocella aquatica]GLR67623.1 hypothetical protein GCM10010909_23040 [Acidocella aquatica]
MPPKQDLTHRDIYALADDRGRVKIGSSNDVWKRKDNLQTGNADELRLVHAEKVERSIASKVERGARKILKDNGHSGVREWINDVPDDDARDAIRTAHDNQRGRNQK